MRYLKTVHVPRGYEVQLVRKRKSVRRDLRKLTPSERKAALAFEKVRG